VFTIIIIIIIIIIIGQYIVMGNFRGVYKRPGLAEISRAKF